MTDLMEPVTGDRRAAAARRRRQRRQAYLSALAFVVILAVGARLRLWHLNISPAWQWDEAVYYRVSVNVQHGVLAEHHTVLPDSAVNREPFLYQPPFYFLLLSRWFSLIGANIYHARLLGVFLTTAMQVVLFRLLWRLKGAAVAVFAVIPVVFDGWLLYIERASYIENALMVLVAPDSCCTSAPCSAAVAALRLPARRSFAGIFKQTGAYVGVWRHCCAGWSSVARTRGTSSCSASRSRSS